MRARDRWLAVGAVGLPLGVMTIYLLWVWPWPPGSSFLVDTGPYVLSLLTGLPFVAVLTRRGARAVVLPAFVVVGFVVLWIYAVGVLCGARGVCL